MRHRPYNFVHAINILNVLLKYFTWRLFFILSQEKIDDEQPTISLPIDISKHQDNLKTKSSLKTKRQDKIPTLPRDIDEAMKIGWNEKLKTTKIIVHPDLNRVWGTAPTENEIEVPCSSGIQRVVEFPGEIEI